MYTGVTNSIERRLWHHDVQPQREQHVNPSDPGNADDKGVGGGLKAVAPSGMKGPASAIMKLWNGSLADEFNLARQVEELPTPDL
jgi:hypothetical protein